MRRGPRFFFRLFRLSAGLTLAAGVGVSARAALSWETTRVEAVADARDTRFEAVFPFRNAGERPVTVLDVRASCGCTTPQLARRRYEPGEGGEVRALFEFGDRVGRQQKTVTVVTDDAPGQPVTLVLAVTIPEPLVLNRGRLRWARGAAASAQTVLIGIDPAATVSDLRAEVDGDAVTATVVPLANGGYRLSVEPRTTADAWRATVRVVATVNGRVRVQPVYAFVR